MYAHGRYAGVGTDHAVWECWVSTEPAVATPTASSSANLHRTPYQRLLLPSDAGSGNVDAPLLAELMSVGLYFPLETIPPQRAGDSGDLRLTSSTMLMDAHDEERPIINIACEFD
nr:unnamed protein product [Spirometra erinaceieuropaei]